MKTFVLCVCWWLRGPAVLLFTTDQPRSEMATLVIYRQREFGGHDYRLYANNNRLGVLSPNRYLMTKLPAGSVKIESKRDFYSDDRAIILYAKPGKTYYVKAVEEIDFMTRALLMAPVSEEQAKRELSRIKPQEPEINPNEN